MCSVHANDNNYNNSEDDVVFGDDDIYFMMKCVFVCHEKLSLSLSIILYPASLPEVLYLKGHSIWRASDENGHFLKKAS